MWSEHRNQQIITEKSHTKIETVYINSIASEYGLNSNFSETLADNIENCRSVSFVSACIPNTIQPLSSAEGQIWLQLDPAQIAPYLPSGLTYSSVVGPITVPTARYYATTKEFVDVLNNQIKALYNYWVSLGPVPSALPHTQLLNGMTVNLDPTTKTLTFVSFAKVPNSIDNFVFRVLPYYWIPQLQTNFPPAVFPEPDANGCFVGTNAFSQYPALTAPQPQSYSKSLAFRIGYTAPLGPYSPVRFNAGFAAPNVQVGVAPPNVVIRSNTIRITSNLVASSHSATKDNNVLCSIPVNARIGNLIKFEAKFPVRLPIACRSVKEIAIRIIDEDGMEISLAPNSYLSLVLALEVDV
jgi:hypothetical protein